MGPLVEKFVDTVFVHAKAALPIVEAVVLAMPIEIGVAVVLLR